MSCSNELMVVFGALGESAQLAEHILDSQQRAAILEILRANADIDGRYDMRGLWELDLNIGGIGAYCLPASPVHNPFPGGHSRDVYRPLQYARSQMEIQRILYNTRYVVQNIGMHLEACLRLLIKEQLPIARLTGGGKTLGAVIKKACDNNLLTKDYCLGLSLLLPLVNASKHEVNQDYERDTYFSPADAIVCYVAARKLGFEVLSSMGLCPVPLAPWEELISYSERINNQLRLRGDIL